MFHEVTKVVPCDRRNTFARLSEEGLHFSWQAQHFGDLHRHFAWQAQHFGRAVLRVLCESYCQGGGNVQIAWQAWDIARVSFCVAGAAFGADPSCVECHFAWQVQYLVLYTLRSTLYTLHSTPRTLHFTIYTLHFTLYTPHFTLHTTLYTPHCALYTQHCRLYIYIYTLHLTL